MSQSRDKQRTSAGVGKHFTSPKKQRDKKKTTTFVHLPTKELRRRQLLARFDALQQGTLAEKLEADLPADPMDSQAIDVDVPDQDHQIDREFAEPASNEPTSTRRILPDTEAARLYKSWKKLLTSLLDPFLTYTEHSIGRVIQPADDLISQCTMDTCILKSTQIQCLYFDRE